MGVLRYKIWYDLWKNKGRTLQVVLIIAMGAVAIGMIIGTRNLVIPNMQASWQAMNPAMINIGAFPSLTEDELIALEDVEGVVGDIEGMSSTTIEYRLTPEDDWTSAGLIAREDYDNQTFNRLSLVAGGWPSGRAFAVEQGSEANFGIPEDGSVFIRVNRQEYQVEIKGTVYNQLVAPATFGGTAQFYTTHERYSEIVDDDNFNQIMATAAKYDEDTVTAIADGLQDKIEKLDKDAFGAGPGRVADPNKHFFQDSLDGLFFFLGVMGALALILGLFLVYNTINAVISQQVDQIGIMKAVGAKTSQILRFYLSIVLVYGLLSLLIAVPIGVVGAWVITSTLIESFNADPGSFTLDPFSIGAQVIIALFTPLLVALVPIFSGARVTVREAINTYGLNTKISWLDRLLAKAERLSRLALLTISNTFRRKWRVVLTQVSLVISALIFMMVVSVRDSVVYTFGDVLFSILNFNVSMVFEDPERIGHIEDLTLAHPDVKAAEMWGFASGTIRLAGTEATEDDESILMFGIPLPTDLYGYKLVKGRWLEPTDTFAIVLNQDVAEEAGVGINDWITVTYDDDKETNWQVVGLTFDPILSNATHAPRDVLLRDRDEVNKASTVWIQTEVNTEAAEVAAAENLRAYYEANQVRVSPQRSIFGISESASEIATTIINQFNFIVILLGVMAIIIGLVGSIALSGTLSLSVMERTREIGVMRAIGASSWSIGRLFIGEGLILGWLSWLIAFPISVVAGQFMLQAMEMAFNIDLIYKYTPTGALLWLVIITILSILASGLPARGATKVSVRESLAYQ